MNDQVRRARWLGFVLGGVALLSSRSSLAQGCGSPRPTDPGGSQGLGYGSAEVAFLDAPSGRARVHYALSGAHAPPTKSTLQDGVPDAVVVAAQAADDAFDVYESLGYADPISDADSPCSSNGDTDAVDIYVINFASADGQAVPDHCLAGSPTRCAGFVLVENDFRGGGYADAAEGMRTVVPHELFHLVQNAYDANLERWWAEGSAQWAAKQVYPELQDLERFLPGYFDNPWRPLNVPPAGVITSFLYATAIWPVFLHEHVNADVVREIYEGFDGVANVFETTDLVLQGRGSSLAQEFLQFSAYNAATAERASDGQGYTSAADYPLVPLEEPVVAVGTLASDNASGLGAFYYSLHGSEPFELSLDADPLRVAALLVPVQDGKPRLDAAAPLPATLEGDGIVVVAGQTLDRKNSPFTLVAAKPGSSKPPVMDNEPDESSCALGRAGGSAANSSAWSGFVVSLLGVARVLERARRRGLKGPRNA